MEPGWFCCLPLVPPPCIHPGILGGVVQSSSWALAAKGRRDSSHVHCGISMTTLWRRWDSLSCAFRARARAISARTGRWFVGVARSHAETVLRAESNFLTWGHSTRLWRTPEPQWRCTADHSYRHFETLSQKEKQTDPLIIINQTKLCFTYLSKRCQQKPGVDFFP